MSILDTKNKYIWDFKVHIYILILDLILCNVFSHKLFLLSLSKLLYLVYYDQTLFNLGTSVHYVNAPYVAIEDHFHLQLQAS